MSLAGRVDHHGGFFRGEIHLGENGSGVRRQEFRVFNPCLLYTSKLAAEGQVEAEVFAQSAQCAQKMTKSNKPYLDVSFADAEGTMGLKVWAVSYTHLDVYKRQVVPGGINVAGVQADAQLFFQVHALNDGGQFRRLLLRAFPQIRPFQGLFIIHAHGAIVTYAALDVYKRQ